MDIADILDLRVIAVVGCSRDETKDAHLIPKYLKEHGYRIIPVNPFADEILGVKCYPSLLEMPGDLKRMVDVVDVFRPSKDVPSIVDQAVALRKEYGTPKVIWMQLGIVNEEAAGKARDAGIAVIMDRCMKIEHMRLHC
ncbi:MAG: CoA-binding protein [Candidatus Hydrothermarchaeaceae archaeon]